MDSVFWKVYDQTRLFVILSAILVFVYIWSCDFEMSKILFGPSKRQLIDSGGLMTSRIDQGEWYRLFSSLFLHGDILHLAFNTSALWVLGRMCETMYGAFRSVLLFLLSGLGGALLSWTMGATLTVGASGALFGLIGALVLLGWKYKDELSHDLGFLLRTRLFVIGILNLVLGLFIPMIDNPSHFGGFIIGIILGLMFKGRIFVAE